MCALYRYGADFEGACSKADFLGKDMTIKCPGKVTYGLKRDGFGIYGFYIQGVGNIYFMGPDKSKAKLNNNRLLLNRVEILDTKGDITRKQAKGQCAITHDSESMATVECNASTDDGNLEFIFKSHLPPDIHDCEEVEGAHASEICTSGS